jgi:hypothetical protein
MERDLPAVERAGIAQAPELLLILHVEDGHTAMTLDEVVVVHNEAAGRILHEGVESLVCSARRRSLGRQGVDEIAAVDQVRCFSRTRAFLPTFSRR